jgi:hypothetical protein
MPYLCMKILAGNGQQPEDINGNGIWVAYDDQARSDGVLYSFSICLLCMASVLAPVDDKVEARGKSESRE